MRICVLTTSYPRGPSDDAGIFVKRLVDAYGKAGASGQVIVPRDAEEPATEEQGSFVVRRFEYGMGGKGRLAFGAGILPNLRRRPWLALQAPSLLAKMAEAAFEAGPEIVHANWLVSALSARWIARRTGVPYAITVRGEDVRLLESKAFGPFIRPVVRSASAVVAVGHDLAQRVERAARIDADRISVIPNGIELTRPPRQEAARIVASHGIAPDEPFLLFVGTVIPRKNVETLVAAMTLPELSRFRLVVCGRLEDSGYASGISRQATSLGNRVKLLGSVPPAEISAFLEMASYYVSASRFEGRPNAVLEAMLCGKAVAVSDIPSHREIVRSGENGILFDSESADALRDAITSLEASAAFRQRLEKRAKDGVSAQTWEQCAKKYLELFDKILSGAA